MELKEVKELAETLRQDYEREAKSLGRALYEIVEVLWPLRELAPGFDLTRYESGYCLSTSSTTYVHITREGRMTTHWGLATPSDAARAWDHIRRWIEKIEETIPVFSEVRRRIASELRELLARM